MHLARDGLGEEESPAKLLKRFLCPLNSHVGVGGRRLMTWGGLTLGNLPLQKLTALIVRQNWVGGGIRLASEMK